MGRTVAIIRQTFRTRGNPLLMNKGKEGGTQSKRPINTVTDAVVLFDLRRVPSLEWKTSSVSSFKWSVHQYWFLLHVVREFIFQASRIGLPVRLVTYADPSELERKMRKVAAKFDDCVVDKVYDEAYDEMNGVIGAVFGSRARHVHTVTLIDWDEHSHTARELVGSAFQRKNRRALEDFIRSTAARSRTTEPADTRVVPNRTPPDASVRRVGEMIREFGASVLRTPALTGAVKLYDFDALWGVDCDLEGSLRRYLRERCASMRKPGWHKPDTAANLSMTQFSSEGRENTSKLSPFLAVGALSARDLLVFFSPGGYARGSAADQLVFREVWYAHAFVDSERKTFWANTRGWWDPNGKYEAKAPSGTEAWGDTALGIQDWVMGTMDPAWEDANESMKMLRREGWIHLLRRHLVADVLCRGQLRMHFLYGEAWFRRTEVDHDAVINRAN
jgi:deoxyribodipyrimidine photolyase